MRVLLYDYTIELCISFYVVNFPWKYYLVRKPPCELVSQSSHSGRETAALVHASIGKVQHYSRIVRKAHYA